MNTSNAYQKIPFTTPPFSANFYIYMLEDSVLEIYYATPSVSPVDVSSYVTYTRNTNQRTNPGGTINVLGSFPYASSPGAVILLIRNTPFKQPFDFTSGGSFPADKLEDALDRVVAIYQELALHMETLLYYEDTPFSIKRAKIPPGFTFTPTVKYEDV